MLVRRDAWLSKTSWRYSCAQRCGESEGLAHTGSSGHRKWERPNKGNKRLTQLRMLQVTGINKKNCHEFCSALEALSCLESLSMSSSGNQGGLRYLSDAVFSCPNNLRTLMLFRYLGKMPAWIMHLRNLVKVRLMCTHLTDSDGTMQLLGNLPGLAILTLDYYTVFWHDPTTRNILDHAGTTRT